MDTDKGTYRADGEKLVTVGQSRTYTYRIVGDTLIRKGFELKKVD